MNTPTAWRIDEKSGESWAVTAEWQARDAALRGFAVTPLVPAPPEQTVEEVTAAVDSLIVAAQNAEPCGDPYHDSERLNAALAEARADLIAFASHAAPPEGAPTYDDLVFALRNYSTINLRALLSRIPKEPK